MTGGNGMEMKEQQLLLVMLLQSSANNLNTLLFVLKQ